MRLRRLERDFEELANDVETCLNAIPKIHAKLRMRATRAATAEIETEEAPSASTSPALAASPSVSTSKLQVRELARQRGFLSQFRSQREAT